MTERAVARRTDPATSWAAARSISEDSLRESQRMVLGIIRRFGPLTDESIYRWATDGSISPSGARTRRAELVAKGLVYDTGRRDRLASGRSAIVWDVVPPGNVVVAPLDPEPSLPVAEGQTPLWDEL